MGSQDLERGEGEDKGGASPLFTSQLYSDWNGQLRGENEENMVDTGKELNSLGFVRSSELSRGKVVLAPFYRPVFV